MAPIIILSILSIGYLLFTIYHFRLLQKSELYTPAVKIFHLVMIWLVPFVWALLLKALSRSAPGSYEVEKKEEPTPFSDNRIRGGLH
jgi:hypothetical protein